MIPTPIQPTPDMPVETVEERFRRLADSWHKGTDYLSSMEEADHHPAYQEIIHLGSEVVPLLSRNLADNHTHWFAALEAIAGCGRCRQRSRAISPKWRKPGFRWAKDNGYQW